MKFPQLVKRSMDPILELKTTHAHNMDTNLSGDPTEMMITWVTMAESVKSVVEYGERYKPPLNKRVFGSATKYEACGWKKRIIHMHRVKLEGLIPGHGYGKGCFFVVLKVFA